MGTVDWPCESCVSLRRSILGEHDNLRALVGKVLAATMEPAKLPLAAETLVDRLAEHIDHEDQLLEPVLDSIDAWGPQRVSRLRDDHVELRRAALRMRAALTGAPQPDAESLTYDVHHFVDEILDHLALEESEFLSAALLRDDPTIVEFGG
jgi:hypothetical protein